MNISKYFTLTEAIKSDVAMRKGIDNLPNTEQIVNMEYLAVNLLDDLRIYVGGPLGVNSFFRSPELNTAIGGSKTSQHCKGQAADVDCDRFGYGSNKAVFDYIRDNRDYDQLIWEFGNGEEPAWVHVSLKKKGNRKSTLRAFRDERGTHYVTFDLY